MVVEAYIYGAYGESAAREPTRRAAYAGHIVDPHLGWYLFGRRIYHPLLRRFLSPDFLSPFDAGGANRYAYCGGDPVGRIDPRGQSWVAWFVNTLGETILSPRKGVSPSGLAYDFQMPMSSDVARSSSQSLTTLSSRASMRDVYNFDRRLLEEYASSLDPRGLSSHRAKVDLSGEQIAITWPYDRGAAASTVFRADKRTVTVISAKDPYFDDPRRSAILAKGRAVPKWEVLSNVKGGKHVASASSVNTKFLNLLVKQLQSTFSDRALTILAGAHGRPNGVNWLDDGTRIGLEQKFFDRVAWMSEQNGWNATVKNYADIDAREFRDMLTRQEGVFIHVTCYGAADVELMKAFNLRDVEIRVNRAV